MPAQTSSPVRSQPSTTDARLRWVEHVAHLMDSQFRLPGTQFRFGLDPLLGLVPIVGDLTTFAVSGMLVLTMLRHGASRHVVIRMALNILIDTILGAVPVIGNIFDFAYKSNDRNVELLRQHYAEGKYQGGGRGLLLAVMLGMAVLLGLLGWGLWALTAWGWQYFHQSAG